MDVDGLPPSASKPGGRASARDSELPQRDDVSCPTRALLPGPSFPTHAARVLQRARVLTLRLRAAQNAPAPEAFVSVKGSRIHETGLIKPPSGVYDMSKGRGRGRPLDHESSGEEDDGYDPRADAERLLEVSRSFLGGGQGVQASDNPMPRRDDRER